MKKGAAGTLPETVCFRLSDPYRKALDRRAKDAGVGRNEYVRQILLAYLEDEARARIESEMRALRTEIAFLRGDFATAVEALLVLAGSGNLHPREAQAWVEARLRQAQDGEG